MTVTVTEHYVPSCPDCCTQIEFITRTAIRDITVAKLTFIPGHRHNHDVAQPPTAAVLEAAGQQTIPGTLVAVEPNGFEVGQ